MNDREQPTGMDSSKKSFGSNAVLRRLTSHTSPSQRRNHWKVHDAKRVQQIKDQLCTLGGTVNETMDHWAITSLHISRDAYNGALTI